VSGPRLEAAPEQQIMPKIRRILVAGARADDKKILEHQGKIKNNKSAF